LYGQHVAVDFVARIRGQQKFDRVEDLVKAIQRDTVRVRAILPSH
jgi:riboflavin kinase / FMN adenylyltransferase